MKTLDMDGYNALSFYPARRAAFDAWLEAEGLLGRSVLRFDFDDDMTGAVIHCFAMADGKLVNEDGRAKRDEPRRVVFSAPPPELPETVFR